MVNHVNPLVPVKEPDAIVIRIDIADVAMLDMSCAMDTDSVAFKIDAKFRTGLKFLTTATKEIGRENIGIQRFSVCAT